MTDQNNTVTKRDFLASIGMVSGTAAMMTAMSGWDMSLASTMTEPPKMSTDGNGKKILILGAGLSGMVCAIELAKKGYNVEVLEAQSTAGGRCMTARKGTVIEDVGGERQVIDFDHGHYLNVGPWRIPAEHHSTIYYCQQLGVELEPFINKANAAYYYSEKSTGKLAGKPVRQGDVDIDRAGHIYEMLAKCVTGGALDETLTQEDQEMLLEHLKATGLIDRRELNYRANLARGWEDFPTTGMDMGKLADPYELRDLMALKIGARYEEADHPPLLFQPKGGMDQISRAMERAIPNGVITYNAEITNIAQTNDGVNVRYKDTRTGAENTKSADYCISCLPFPLLNKISNDFSPEIMAGIKAPASDPIVKQGHQFSHRFWEKEEDIFGGVSANDHPHSLVIAYPNSNFFGTNGGVLLTAYARKAGCIELSNMSIKEREEVGLAIAEKIHPGRARKYYNGKFASLAWHRQKYALSAWVKWSRRNINRHMPNLVKGERRVIISGNGMAPLHNGWMFAAIESAWRSMEDLDKRVAKSS